VDEDLRAEAEEDERLAALALLRDRTLGDVARELLHRGDRIAAVCPGRTATGLVIAAAGDLLTVQSAAGAVDLRLGPPVLVRVLDRARAGGAPAGRGAQSFTARLYEHEAGGGRVAIGWGPTGEEVVGRITAVARDHLVVAEADGTTAFLPLAAVWWVTPRPAPLI
jgi:hypothetical protein